MFFVATPPPLSRLISIVRKWEALNVYPAGVNLAIPLQILKRSVGLGL